MKVNSKSIFINIKFKSLSHCHNLQIVSLKLNHQIMSKNLLPQVQSLSHLTLILLLKLKFWIQSLILNLLTHSLNLYWHPLYQTSLTISSLPQLLRISWLTRIVQPRKSRKNICSNFSETKDSLLTCCIEALNMVGW